MRLPKTAAVLLAAILLLTVPAGTVASAKERAAVRNAPAQTADECESAQEMVDNITMGWNLGLALSPSLSPTVDRYVSRIVCTDGAGNAYRSETDVYFHPKDGTAEIVWNVGGDPSVPRDAPLGRFGIELYNRALSDGDTVTVAIDGFSYTLNDGEAFSPVIGRSDRIASFRDGRGGVTVCEAQNGLRFSDIREIRAEIRFLGVDTVGVPPHDVGFYETLWGSPATTQELIDFVAARGFNIIRPQVSWINHIDADGNIDPAWMERVAEVVDYHVNAGVYCMINLTGAGWLTTEPENFEENKKLYQKLWEQISARFRDYGELLIFESMNETFYTEYLLDFPSEESSRIVNELNQIFVDTVRAQGGYNRTRNLCVNTYGTIAYYDATRAFLPPSRGICWRRCTATNTPRLKKAGDRRRRRSGSRISWRGSRSALSGSCICL